MDLPEYHDFGIEFEGQAVQSLQASFLQSWLVQENNLEPETHHVDFARRYFPRPTIDGANSLPVKLIHAVPKGDSEYKQSILDIVDTAQDTLDINFAYILIPEFIERVRKAAERGVKVRILVPGEDGTDKESTWLAFRSHYPDLLKTGNVQMLEFKTYTHCKFIVADSRMVFTSTGNPEYNSWEGGWDETALIDSPQFAAEIERRVFDVDFAPNRADDIDLAEVASLSLWGKIKQFFFLLIIRLFQTPSEPQLTRKKIIRRPIRSGTIKKSMRNPLQLQDFSAGPPKFSRHKNSVSPLTEEESRFE
jgi:phosphatidylserine/phosphatidylglycerophosphate/cardiolipin synthase-like enzyme